MRRRYKTYFSSTDGVIEFKMYCQKKDKFKKIRNIIN